MPRTSRSSDLRPIVRRISRNLRGIGRDFLVLGRAIESGLMSRAAKSAGPGGDRKTRRRALNAADRARLRIQGEYLGLVRHLSRAHRARIKALRASKGYPAAIKAARGLMGRRG
jgi:hypothetical protein